MTLASTGGAAVPIYALYGEPGLHPGFDQLHCESIAQRSRLHGWEIQPHRHEHLYQILHLEQGRMDVRLDGGAGPGTRSLDSPALVCVPALAPHGFRFDEDVRGTVITVFEPHLDRLLRNVANLRDSLAAAHGYGWQPGDAAHRHVEDLVHRLTSEYHASEPWRAAALDATLLALLVHLGRQHHHAKALTQPKQHRGEHHVRRLRALVDERFRQQPGLSDLARELGISPTHLNRACHAVLGHSALGVLHRRLIVEAQRDLAYTGLSVKEVAWGLGFADPAYFTRFFQRMTGLAPTQWRAGLGQRVEAD